MRKIKLNGKTIFSQNLISLWSREGMIIEWPLNGFFHYRRDLIITSQMVVIRFPSNDVHYLKCWKFVIVKSHYYDDQKTAKVIITKSNDLEIRCRKITIASRN